MKAFDFHKVIDNSYVDRLVKDGFFEKLYGPAVKPEAVATLQAGIR